MMSDKLNIALLSVIMLSFTMLSFILLNVAPLSVITLCVIMLSVVTLSVVMSYVIMLSVVAPRRAVRHSPNFSQTSYYHYYSNAAQFVKYIKMFKKPF
jgi:hypothetical protein